MRKFIGNAARCVPNQSMKKKPLESPIVWLKKKNNVYWFLHIAREHIDCPQEKWCNIEW